MWPFKKKPKRDLHVIDLKPGDVLVIGVEDMPTQEGAKNMADALFRQLGFRVQIMFVPPDAKISVLRGSTAPEPTPTLTSETPIAP